MFAYYSKEGELQAVTRNILSAQLPINLLGRPEAGATVNIGSPTFLKWLPTTAPAIILHYRMAIRT